jgi:hypothetical protein
MENRVRAATDGVERDDEKLAERHGWSSINAVASILVQLRHRVNLHAFA